MKHQITLEHAVSMTKRFHKHKKTIVNPAFPGRDILPNAETFDRAIFDYVLSRPGCTGLRVYYGLNDANQLRTIIVGVDTNNNDMLPTELTTTTSALAFMSMDSTSVGTDPSSSTDPTSTTDPTEGGDVVIEDGTICPPVCPVPSPLNP